jgi:Tfp pilus assembly protein PilE
MTRRLSHRQSGLTVIEMLTVLVALVVLAAIAIPLWHTYQMRVRREGAVDALLAVQTAQDKHFAAQAQYADDAQTFTGTAPGLGVSRVSAGDFYRVEVQRTADRLGYVAVARANKVIEGVRVDSRCHEFRLDEQNRRWSLDLEGEDSTADCWNRL